MRWRRSRATLGGCVWEPGSKWFLHSVASVTLCSTLRSECVLAAACCLRFSGMCITRCSRFVGVSLVPMAILCMVANTLLLFPNLETRYLLEHHVTREAVWSSGLWASGLLVRIVCVCLSETLHAALNL
ncbi:transmembrane 4 L6 family member 5-like [Arapaima gigas]